MDLKGIDKLLERYRNGECTAAEKKTLEEWFDAQAAKGSWEWDEAQAKATGTRIKDNIDKQLVRKKTNWPLLRIAAILLLTLGCALIFREEVRDLADPVVMVEKRVNEGEQLKLTLPDGSKVFLNAGTRFSYPSRFTKGKRQVNLLEGEGYFEVIHDPSNPFIVTSKSITTKVLGTAFNVKAYRYLSNLQVAVTRGKVRVSDSSGTQSALVLPNQQLTIDVKNGVMLKHAIDLKAITAWQRGNFAFNNDRLVDVCAALSKKYKIGFNFEQKEIQDYRITAGFEAQDNISDVLSILASANDLAYEQKGNMVTFKKRSK